MEDTNLVAGVVKILEPPKQKMLKENIPLTSFRAQFPESQNTFIVHLKFWGILADDLLPYYKMNDYVVIEGHLSMKEEENFSTIQDLKTNKKVEITVLKIYPFFLASDPSNQVN